ncbi:hypothetical protein A2G96_07990 [Cupriavidus nantongensis]|uniref:YbjN domain-containing protein n=1 Tax=Cupriavidus nantongensis TaxID=1796606 RepID=A0A142JHW7_9BURK|nr:hypothetical protein A2G96_07990 [Cupriavidus nantongensis]
MLVVANTLAHNLQERLANGVQTHFVELQEIDIGHSQRDLVFQTPFGKVWGRFGIKRDANNLFGVLDLFRRDRKLDGTTEMVRMHGLLFNDRGLVSLNATQELDWDWDIAAPDEGDAMQFARNLANTLSAKFLELVTDL